MRDTGGAGRDVAFGGPCGNKLFSTLRGRYRGRYAEGRRKVMLQNWSVAPSIYSHLLDKWRVKYIYIHAYIHACIHGPRPRAWDPGQAHAYMYVCTYVQDQIYLYQVEGVGNPDEPT